MNKLLIAVLAGLLIVPTVSLLFGKPTPNAPIQIMPSLIGRVNLTEGFGIVSNSFIHAGMLCIFNVVSPDSLSEGARVSVYQLDEGVVVFWSHTSDSNPTEDEPEVNFSIWRSSGAGTYP